MEQEIVEIADPNTGKTFFANTTTGECFWEAPKDAHIRPRDPQVEWWELFDEQHKINYYYNTTTKATEWERPVGVIIPLSTIQKSAIGKTISFGAYVATSSSESSDGARRSLLKESAEPTTNDARESTKDKDRVPKDSSTSKENVATNKDNAPEAIAKETSADSAKEPIASEPIKKEELTREVTKKEVLGRSLTSKEASIDRAATTKIKGPEPIPNEFSMESAVLGVMTKEALTPATPTSFEAATTPQSIQNTVPANSPDEEKKVTSASNSVPSSKENLNKGSTTSLAQKAQNAVKHISASLEKLNMTRASHSTLAAKNARSLGISNPSLNVEAAIAMNPLTDENLKNTKTSLPALQAPRILPAQLKDDISKFRIDGFANKYFSQHRAGIFRRKVPVEKMLKYQKDSLKAPLLILNENLHKDAIKCFKYILKVMSPKGDIVSTYTELAALLEKGIRVGSLRDEIYVQICKQLNANPSKPSVYKGWQLMDMTTSTFPPSKNLENYLRNFIHSGFGLEGEGGKLDTIIKHAAGMLNRIVKIGPRGRTLTLAEVDHALNAPFNSSVFGDTLDNIMERQLKDSPNEPIPRILSFLADSILKLNGAKTEGIFRVPGDTEVMSDLRCRIDKGEYELGNISDPNVPGSLLKLWLRELSDPLIPTEFYTACIQAGSTDARTSDELLRQAIAILDSLPSINKKVVVYMLKFLQTIALPQNQPITKMNTGNLAMVFAPNFLRCPSDDPATIFENTKFEQAFLRSLINGPLPAEPRLSLA